jgi:hypothetical protein
VISNQIDTFISAFLKIFIDIYGKTTSTVFIEYKLSLTAQIVFVHSLFILRILVNIIFSAHVTLVKKFIS